MSRGSIELRNRNVRLSTMGAVVLVPWPTRSSKQSLSCLILHLPSFVLLLRVASSSGRLGLGLISV